MKKPSGASKATKLSKPPMPCFGSDGKASSTSYNGGKIYVDVKHNRFRVIKDNNKPSQEASIKWNKKRPSATEWDDALSKIDEYIES